MNRSALVTALCALALIQAYVVYYIFVYGPLRGAVPYDDCGVILRNGIFLAAAMLVLFDAAESGSVKGKIVGSSLLALALLCKMTAFYQPAPVLATFIAFELYGAMKHRWTPCPGSGFAFRALAGFRFSYSQAKLWALCSSIILAPYIFFFLYNRHHFMAYISWGLEPTWHDNLTMAQRLASYMPFEAPDAWGSLHV
jgi:hypothetical protein